jgi:hypothetical protein
MGWFSFLAPIFEHFGQIGSSYMKRKRVEAEGRIKIEAARAEAKAAVIITRLEADIEWEKSMASASHRSWKDEFWTIILAIPMVLAFFPPAIPFLEDGFNILSQMPEWYGISIGLAISAAFGKNIVQYFTNMKK